MGKTITNCDCCGHLIKYGEPFIGIARSVEVVNFSIALNDTYVNVVDHQSLLFLCKKCGNRYHTMMLMTVMKNLSCSPSKVAEN